MATGVAFSTYDWIRLHDGELLHAGADPTDRLRLTGHTRCLAEPYLASIGTWGACDVHELINDRAPHLGKVPVSEAAYRRFASRHRLLGKSQFARRHGRGEWTRALVCYRAYRNAQDAFGIAAPIGTACHYASARVNLLPGRRGLGLLPVEVVLWTRVFDAMLTRNGLVPEDWEELTDADKAVVWQNGDDGRPWSILPFLLGAAIRRLEPFELAAAS